MQNGRTFDAETGEPLPFVSIAYRRNGETRTTASDANAVYNLQADAGSPVAFAGVGFSTFTMTYRPGVVNVSLSPSTTELPPLVITPTSTRSLWWPWLILGGAAALALRRRRRNRRAA